MNVADIDCEERMWIELDQNGVQWEVFGISVWKDLFLLPVG